MLGVCYYPEHWPKSYWADDAAKMRTLGLTYVRIGEFAWSRLEPREGCYQFGWMDEAIDTLAKEGLKIIIGTPTATPPKWLVDKFPDILPVDPGSGQVRGFGSRRHYDFSSEEYLRQSLRITELLAKRYGNYLGVVGWQTDNELCCHDTALSGSASACSAFQRWCEIRYGSINELNHAWGTVFWSMEYGDFSEIELPIGAVTETSPAHRLAYRRFSSDQVVQYHKAMVEVIRKYSPDTFVTHNFIPTSDTNVDNYALAAPLDFTSYDNYPLGRTDMMFADCDASQVEKYTRTGHPDYATFFHDQTRGLSNGAYWIMEQQPGPVNWAAHNPKPTPGMIRLWTLEAFAHGASCVCYFRWRQVPFAQEQMHAGLLRPDSSKSDAWVEIEQARNDIETLKLNDLPQSKANVAILINSEGQWISDIEKQGAGYDFWQVQFAFYSSLRRLGLDVDYVSIDSDFDQYKMVVVPGWPIIEPELVDKLRLSKARFIFGPRSGAKNIECAYPQNLPPGALQELMPFKVLSVDTMRKDCPETFYWQEKTYTYHSWREDIEVGGCEVVAATPSGSPLVIQKDNIVYMASLTNELFLRDFFERECQTLALEAKMLDDDIRISRRGDLTFAFNYSSGQKHAPIPDNAEVLMGTHMVEPYSVSVWRSS